MTIALDSYKDGRTGLNEHAFNQKNSWGLDRDVPPSRTITAALVGGEYYIYRKLLLETDIEELTTEDFVVSLPEGKYGILRDTIEKGTAFDIIVGRVVDSMSNRALPTGIPEQYDGEVGDFVRIALYTIPIRNRDRLAR